ncbi:branched-chain amino acid transport system II carrier protein [Ammoniphilus oxalaticus]|uniref:Branched-chain amino acid transport system carrier protein n=1 Tax=Ammoniphilus oxalaticus TaxID=66863 RepID=A0A419SNR3_9BACL|nr:branched-chain amino acid transport system II carrier protein [Ammoniphilus oxalaticus]RKD25869.1 branched-chain amino acid transport system II carrier protein [Ammoniphilus oxalaticus]
MKNTLPNKEIVFVGLMIFSLFFGAGNLIFPPELGQKAGENMGFALGGFLISGVGLPLLGVLAIAYASGGSSTEDLSKKVHPLFAVVLTAVTYLTVGPFFAAPRTGVVSYEIAIVPFLTDGGNAFTLAIFTFIYFAIAYVLALNPSKFVDRIGKMITPFLLSVLFILIAAVISRPIDAPQTATGSFAEYPFFKGITEGYLTMDTIVSIVFGMIIINAIQDRGVHDKKQIRRIIWKAGIIAVVCLSAVYVGLGYLGATSSSMSFTSGAAILSGISQQYFGVYGNVLLGIVILLACIPTAVGLISSCALYFNKLMPTVSYQAFILFFSIFSGLVANVGLAQLIRLSVPVLNFIYPIVITLIALTFLDKLFKGHSFVYRGAVLFTLIVSLNDGLVAMNEKWDFIAPILNLPLAEIGFGWIVPALVGGVAGWLLSFAKRAVAVFSKKPKLNDD